MTCLLLAPDIRVVLLGRVLQGVATGAATGALSAALIELAPMARKSLGTVVGGLVPASGLAVGALATGIVVQISRMPIVITFVALDVVFILGVVGVAQAPEPGTPRPGALRSLIPHVRVPRPARREFAGCLPAVVADWMTGGLFLGLVPQIMRGIFGVQSGFVNGAAIAILCGFGALSIFLTRTVAPRAVVIIGASALAVGMGVAVVAMGSSSLIGFGVGTVIAGIGFGTVFAGGIRLIAPLALPEQRGGMFSAIYFTSYLAFGFPVIVAGILIGACPLPAVVTGYGVIAATCALVGVGIQLRLRRLDLPGPSTPPIN